MRLRKVKDSFIFPLWIFLLLVSSLPSAAWASDSGVEESVLSEAPNQPPIATEDTYAVDIRPGTLEVPAPGILANDTDPEGELLTAIKLTDPEHGMLTFNADGSFTYVHDGSETTSDSFTYVASDGKSKSIPATVKLSIIDKANTPPTANDDAYALDEGDTLAVPAPGILANDTDPEDDPLIVTKLTDPTHGTLSLNPDGSFIYMCSAPHLVEPASGTGTFATETRSSSPILSPMWPATARRIPT